MEQKREELRQKMEEAVADENFEDAAKYRDELRALEAQEVSEASEKATENDEKGEIRL